MAPRKHQELLTAAIARDGEAQQALLDGRPDAARAAFAQASELYQQSWVQAPPRSYGRLVGMLKTAVLAGGTGTDQARYVCAALADASPDSSTVSYGRALAALILGEDADAQAWAHRMGAGEKALGRTGEDAFARTGEAIAAVAAEDQDRYARALGAIVSDFEERREHLTGVAIADTALVLEALAARRGLSAAIDSPVLPAIAG